MDEDELFRKLADKIGLNLASNSEFQNKELQQRWDIAQLNERGASARQSSSNAASTRNAQISANASTKNAKLAAETSRYGIDTTAQTARERLGLDTELGRGDLAVRQGALGLSALELPTKYRGPQDYFQQSDLLHGLSQRADIPFFISKLLDPTIHPGEIPLTATVTPGGSPAGFSIGNTIAGLAGQSGAAQGATGGQNGTALAAIRQLGARGLQSLGPQALEQLNPSELGALQSGFEYSGDNGPSWSWSDLLNQYNKSRIGGMNAFAA